MQNPKIIATIQAALKNKPLYIADGHHRYATAEAFYRKKPDNPFARYHFCYLTNLHDPGLKILPTHRLIDIDGFSGVFDPLNLIEKLSPYFTIREPAPRLPLYEEIKKIPHTFGLAHKERTWLLTLREDIDLEAEIRIDAPLSVKSIDYAFVHYLLIEKALGVPYPEQNKDSRISYLKELTDVLRQARAGKLACIMRELDVRQMLQVCADGAITPQKSTFFYPKVHNGAVFASINPEHFTGTFDAFFG